MWQRSALRRPRRGMALVMAFALTMAACAGSVGQYRDAAPQEGGLGVPLAESGAVGGPGGFGQGDGAGVSDSGGAVSGGSVPGGGIGAGTTQGGATGGSAGGASGQAAPAGIGSTVGVTEDSITLGLFYAKTGIGASISRRVPDAVQAALDEAGRLYGRKLILKTYDDGTEDAQTIQAEEKRAKDEVFLYMSLLNESNEVLAPLAEQHRVPNVLAALDQRTGQGLRYSFVVTAYFAHEATILPSFIKNYLKAGNKRIGISHDGTTQSLRAIDAFKAKARTMGLNVVFEQFVGMHQSACANEISNFQAHDVELIYMHNGIFGASCLLRDAHAVGYDPIWTGVGPLWNLNLVVQAVGRDAINGAKVINAFTTLETPAGRHFQEVMRESGNGDLAEDDIMFYYYALAVMAIENLRRTGADLGREAYVRSYETNMNGFNSGFFPPPHFGPGDRSGPQHVNVSACCSDRNWWFTEQSQWRKKY